MQATFHIAYTAWLLVGLGFLREASAREGNLLRVKPKYLSDPADQAWLDRDENIRDRAAESGAAAAFSADKARGVANSLKPGTVIPKGSEAEAEAREELKAAVAINKKATAMLPTIQEQAYAAGWAAAEKEVSRLSAEAQDYFESLKTDFEALATPNEDAKQKAMKTAAQPYWDAEMKLQGLAKFYNEQARNAVLQARRLTEQAKGMAVRAGYEQKEGKTDLAQRHMLQAHADVAIANENSDIARGTRRLAEHINDAIPGYQQAQKLALDHTAATWPEGAPWDPRMPPSE